MTRSIVRVLVLVLIVTPPLPSRRTGVWSRPPTTTARPGCSRPRSTAWSSAAPSTRHWLPDGRFWYVRTTLTGTENVVVDPVKKTREVVATPPAARPAARRRAGGRGGRGGGGGGAARRARRSSRSRRPAGPTSPA